MIKDAKISEDGIYRYLLLREWDKSLPKVLFIMLNPSTADATIDDNTIRKCIHLAKYWEYGSIEVVNLFAYRATNPEQLPSDAALAIGPENDSYIKDAAEHSNKIIAAWGGKGKYCKRDNDVKNLLFMYDLYCLGLTKEGNPRHPLYVKVDAKPILYTKTITLNPYVV